MALWCNNAGLTSSLGIRLIAGPRIGAAEARHCSRLDVQPTTSMKKLLSFCALVWMSLALPGPANGVLFTNDITILFTDTNYDGIDIVVSNCVVTVDGAHSFLSLTVAGNG